MDARAVHSDAVVGLALGAYATAVLLMLFWILAPVVWLPAVHFLFVEIAWLFAWGMCAREGRPMLARVVLFGGALVTVAVVFALLGVFVRVYK